MSREYQSWLAPLFVRFVTLKHGGGYSFGSQEYLLKTFDRYLNENAPTAPLRADTLVAYLASLERLSPRGRDNTIDVVWKALAFAKRHDAQIDPLPPRPQRPPWNFRLLSPRIISHKEIRTIIGTARRLPHARHLRGDTYATLYGLLFATGMRIGEALALDIGDVDIADGLITVRHGKFDKTRVLPLKASVSQILVNYIKNPRRPIGDSASDPLFVSGQKRRLAYDTASDTFRKVCIAASISRPLPRLHDLRHSFVVQSVLQWYRTGTDVNALLPALSTYLGHASIEGTRTYLQSNGLLLEEASKRFSTRWTQLYEVLS